MGRCNRFRRGDAWCHGGGWNVGNPSVIVTAHSLACSHHVVGPAQEHMIVHGRDPAVGDHREPGIGSIAAARLRAVGVEELDGPLPELPQLPRVERPRPSRQLGLQPATLAIQMRGQRRHHRPDARDMLDRDRVLREGRGAHRQLGSRGLPGQVESR